MTILRGSHNIRFLLYVKVNKPAGLEELEGDCEGGGEVGDLLCGDVLHRLLVLPDVLVGRLYQLSLS